MPSLAQLGIFTAKILPIWWQHLYWYKCCLSSFNRTMVTVSRIAERLRIGAAVARATAITEIRYGSRAVM